MLVAAYFFSCENLLRRKKSPNYFCLSNKWQEDASVFFLGGGGPEVSRDKKVFKTKTKSAQKRNWMHILAGWTQISAVTKFDLPNFTNITTCKESSNSETLKIHGIQTEATYIFQMMILLCCTTACVIIFQPHKKVHANNKYYWLYLLKKKFFFNFIFYFNNF